MKKVYIIAAALLLATPAFAASTCAVKEYGSLTDTTRGGAAQIAAPGIVDQGDIDFSGGATSSAAFNVQTKFIRVKCYAQAAFSIGTAPVATTSMSWMSAGETEYFGVASGHKISFVAKP